MERKGEDSALSEQFEEFLDRGMNMLMKQFLCCEKEDMWKR